MDLFESFLRRFWTYRMTGHLRVRDVPDDCEYHYKGIVRVLYGERRYVLSNLLNIGPLDDYGLAHLQGEDICAIVDVGANVGMFALVARQKFRTARIVAYEPCSETRRLLKWNLDGLNVDVRGAAVGREDRRVQLALADNLETCRVVDEGTSERPVEVVEQVSLDTIAATLGDSIDLLKLDCEGAEYEIMQTDAFGRVARVVGELHSTESGSPSKGRAMLMKRGFVIDRWREVESGARAVFLAQKCR